MHGFVDSAEEPEAKSPKQLIEYTMLHCLLLTPIHFISFYEEKKKNHQLIEYTMLDCILLLAIHFISFYEDKNIHSFCAKSG